jgi:sulfur carrier protein ThiS
MMKVVYRNKEINLPHGMTVRDAIIKAGLDPEAILALRAGKLINEDTIVQENDTITLVAVVSGG